MPSTRPCAAFEPLPPNFDLKSLVEDTPNFEWVTRIHCDMIEHHGLDNFDRLVLMHVVLGGKPLVIEGYDRKLDKWIFALQWLRDNCGSQIVDARDLTKQANVPMSIGHYLSHMALLTNQWTSKNYKETDRQRMYLKDIDCPDMWHEKIKANIPPGVFYLNESTGDVGDLGLVDGSGSHNSIGIARAGDLMSSLPKDMRAENLMCYIGHEGTYTPAHREMCASLGHNIMVEASNGSVEDGKLTKPGSSIWFMTETCERKVVSEYWLSRLGHDIEVEKHFAQVNAWKNAPFRVWIVEQKPGDFILIPPLAPHQVWNRGTRTMKIAWNRTTVETLEMALQDALPSARMVCRDEQYKNKAIVYYTLQKYSNALKQAAKLRHLNLDSKAVKSATNKISQLGKDFKRLLTLFTKILVSESFFPSQIVKKVEMLPFEGFVTCSYCRCNIFNRFLTCSACVIDLPDGEKDTYDVCLDCYAMGRSCACISRLKWVEQWDWNQLVQNHDQWRQQIVQNEGKVNEKSPKLFKTELDLLGKKRTLAQICQLELIKRPFRDIKKPKDSVDPHEDLEEDVQVDENGNIKKKKLKKKSEKFIRDHARCHIDCHWEPKWKQATCSHCDKNYCYGTLFRAYDMMPQDIMMDPDWQCPSCRGRCNCRHCRNKPGYWKYTPKGTLLGHNTKAVADARSVESLVDFSFSNIGWIQKAGDDHDAEDTERLQRRRREAQVAMATDPQLGDNYVDTEADTHDVNAGILRLAEQEGIPIDPALAAEPRPESVDEDVIDENPEDATKNKQDLLPSSHFLLPEGGVIQNAQYAYAINDAVTFVYPEPILSSQLPPAPVEGYQEAIVGNFYSEEVLQPQSPATIEMVNRKRKRNSKVDEGDRPYHQKKSHNKKTPVRKRQSLVIKLAVPKDRLLAIKNSGEHTQTSLGTSMAPTVSSDLHALNVNPTPASTQTRKRQRLEDEAIEMVDEEYAPSRRHDRRKTGADGNVQPLSDAETSRRTTRIHNVRYDEPDEEEFNEVVVPVSKKKTMDIPREVITPAIEISDGEDDSDSESDIEQVILPALRDNSTTTPPNVTTTAVHNRGVDVFKRTPSVQNLPANSRSAASNSLQISHQDKALVAEAAANKRAKMAVIEGNDISAFDDSWSADESLSPPEQAEGNPNNQRSSESSSTYSKSPAPSNSGFKATQQMPTRISGMSTTPLADAQQKRQTIPLISNTSQITARTTLPAKAVSAQKASTKDWGDSDSSEDEAPYRPNLETSGFTAVNRGIGNHTAMGKKIGNHTVPNKGVRGRPRGRPRASR